MQQNKWNANVAFVLLGAVTILAGCTSPATAPALDLPRVTVPSPIAPSQIESPVPNLPGTRPSDPNVSKVGQSVQVVADPADINILVNKGIRLPAHHVPDDLVEPHIPFIFAEKAEKRLMRQEAARALEQLVAAAKQDQIYLAGVSGYRSYETQESLFNYYVRTDGEASARRYSAEPGHSEHQTGLAMDLSGSTGQCAAEDCFADTPEAKWLAEHAPKYGFIIRYPQGKESVTGYAYEPWHLRYVGVALATDIFARGLTLEEHYGQGR